jgi:glucose-1-phosphate thymidylyltransferase
MIFYPIQTLVTAGIEEIMVVVSGPHAGDFIPILKNGEDFGLKRLVYAYQYKPNGGIADALSLAEDFADNDPIVVILGDNTTDANISDAIEDYELEYEKHSCAMVFLKEVSDPHRFGVARFMSWPNETPDKLIGIDEKPENPSSNLAVTGVYIYDHNVFEFIRRCSPSARGELEITDVNNFYIERDAMMHRTLDGYWKDAGTFDSLLEAGVYWRERAQVQQ